MSGPKLAIFGATGNTGSSCLEEAVKSGFQVTVLVRDPARLKMSGTFNTVVGDAMNIDDVRKVIDGQDMVLAVLGTNNQLEPTTLFSESMRHILQAMGENNIRRVTVCNSAFMFWQFEKVPERLRDLTLDHKRQLEILQASSLDWIAVCPPHIADDPKTGKYKTAIGSSPGRRIPKDDLAHFLVHSLDDGNEEYYRQLVGLCTSE